MNKYEKPNGYTSNDVVSYYAYVTATFIHKDLSLGFIDKGIAFDKYWPAKTPPGKYVIKTTMGLAVLYTPFFFIGHGFAHLLSFPADGYSTPYQTALMISCLVYLLIGLIFMRKILLRYFSESVTAWTLFAIVLATNLYSYATFEATMSHVYNFSLVTLFVYLTFKWYEKKSLMLSALLGLLFGLIALIRPSNAVVIIFFGLYGITSVRAFKERMLLFIHQFSHVLIIAISALLVWVPQLIYWKMQSGQFLFNSYVGERFFFTHPHIIDVLFSYRKGWFVYSPIMLFSLAGMVLLFKKYKELFLPVLVFFLINLYIISSWWCWWYGGSFGQRSMIDSYGIMAIPLALTIATLFSLGKVVKNIFASLIVILSAYSIFNTFQYEKGYIHYHGMTKEAYWAVFLKLKHPDGYWEMLREPDYNKALKGECESRD